MGVKKKRVKSDFLRVKFVFCPHKGWNSIQSEAQVETERSEVKRG